jgi:hypothetical protein
VRANKAAGGRSVHRAGSKADTSAPRRLAWPVALALLAAACSGAEEDGRAASTVAPTTAPSAPSTAPATTAAPAGPEAEVLADYRAFWDDLVAAGATANPRSPRLDDHATGAALAQARATYTFMRARGLVARGTVKVRAKVVAVRGGTATVYDCNSTSNFLAYDAKTGKLRDRSSGRSNGMTVSLVRDGGTWKVAKTATEVGTCTR